MHMKRIGRLWCMALLLLLLPIQATAFSDVSNGDQYSAAINMMSSLNVIGGVGDGTYRPEDPITREQMAKVLFVIHTGTDNSLMFKPSTAPFDDVSIYAWSAAYINWAKNLNILSGVGENRFAPTENVTYAQLAKMFITTLGDTTAYDYPYGYINRAQALGLFTGVNNVGKDDVATRGAVAQMAYNTLFAPATAYTNGARTLMNGAFRASKLKDATLNTEEYVITEASRGLVGNAITEENQIYVTPIQGSTKGTPTLQKFRGDATPFMGMKVYLWATNSGEVVGIEISPNQKIYYTSPATYKNDAANKANTIIVDNTTLTTPSGLEKRLETKDGNRYTLIDWDSDYKIDFANTSTQLIGKVTLYDGRNLQFLMSGGPLTDGKNTNIGLIDLTATDKLYHFNLPQGLKVGDIVSLNRGVDFGGKGVKIAGYDVKILLPESHIHNRSVPNGTTTDMYFDDRLMSNAAVVFPKTIANNAYRLGETYYMHTNRNGYIVYSEVDKFQESAVQGHLFVMESRDGEAGALGYNAKLNAMLEDGTKKVFEISDSCPVIETVYTAEKKLTATGKVFAYATDREGKIIALQPIGEEETGASFDSKVRLFKTSKYYVLADDAKVFTYQTDPTKVRLMQGRDIVKPLSGATLASKNDGLNIEIAVVKGVVAEGGAGGVKLGFVTKFEKSMAVSPGKVVGHITMAMDGQVSMYNTYDLPEFKDTTGKDIQKNTYYIVEMDAAGNVIAMDPNVSATYTIKREVIVRALQSGLVMASEATWFTEAQSGERTFVEEKIKTTSGTFFPYADDCNFYLIATRPKEAASGALDMLKNGYNDNLPLTTFVREGVMGSNIVDDAFVDYYYVADYAVNKNTGYVTAVTFYVNTVNESKGKNIT